jgi:hypothetical protein
VTFLTPLAALVGLTAIVPLAAALAGRVRAERVRRVLRLSPSPPDRLAVGLVVLVPLLLALAAAQPALSRRSGERVRTDAAAIVVVDVSRSMLASRGRTGPTRLARARADAIRIRAGLPGVPVGLATLTDRVLPLLFPSTDAATFDSTVRSALRDEEPPPLELAPNATTFAALSALGTDGFFAPTLKKRVVVLLTDGESQPFDAASTGAALGASLVVERLWNAAERIYGGAAADAAYRPDPAAGALVAQLVSSTRGTAASGPGTAAAAVRRDLGAGPTRAGTGGVARTPLAPYVALAALVPLGLLLRRRTLATL